jgi:ATP synthase protein I
MTQENTDDRPPMAVAMEWSARLTTIALEMVIPPAGGYWLDGRIGTSPAFVIVGAILGFVLGIFHLVQLARQQRPPTSRS